MEPVLEFCRGQSVNDWQYCNTERRLGEALPKLTLGSSRQTTQSNISRERITLRTMSSSISYHRIRFLINSKTSMAKMYQLGRSTIDDHP